MNQRPNPVWDRPSAKISLVTVFTALCLGTNYALAGFPNVKFMDAFYFIATYEFGPAVGVTTVLLTRTIYATVNPWGPASGWLIGFLVGGDLIYAFSGALLRRSKLIQNEESLAGRSVRLGLVGLFSALAFDLITNFGTGLLVVQGQNIPAYLWRAFVFGLITMNFPLPMGIIHEFSDFFFFAILVPSTLAMLKRSGLLAQDPLYNLSGPERSDAG